MLTILIIILDSLATTYPDGPLCSMMQHAGQEDRIIQLRLEVSELVFPTRLYLSVGNRDTISDIEFHSFTGRMIHVEAKRFVLGTYLLNYGFFHSRSTT